MFVKTNPQRSLLECEFLLPPEKVERLKKSWAEPFRQRILPLIDEEIFRDAFTVGTGRPNKSIKLLVGVHVLKECDDLTDAQVLDQLEYNLQWHYALGIDSETAHLCQKTMHNFRVKLMANDRAQLEFEHVTRALAEADGLNLGRQRLDSTHVLSNIAVLTRLGLFVETVTHFLKELRKEDPEAFGTLESGYTSRYLDREGYFSDAKREQARRRLPVVAQDIYMLVHAFETDATVNRMPAFELLLRLFEEQCEVVSGDEKTDVGPSDDETSDGGDSGTDSGADNSDSGIDDGDEDAGDGSLRARLLAPKEIRSDSLQSPHDPDATYGHKGKGYEVQISETCHDDNAYQVVTATAVNGAHESDQHAVIPMLDQLENSGMKPEIQQADTGYGSGENIVECAKRCVNLQAPVQDPDAPEPTEHFGSPVWKEAESEASDKVEQKPVDSGPLGLERFTFNSTFDRVLACPSGNAPERQGASDGVVHAIFSACFCAECPMASRCPTRELKTGDRQLRRASTNIATECRQAEQQTAEFKESYRKRSGIEATNQEIKDRHGLADLRVRGKPRVELSVHLKALALNVKRSVQYHVSNLAKPALCPCMG